jgi:hypothetical protein
MTQIGERGINLSGGQKQVRGCRSVSHMFRVQRVQWLTQRLRAANWLGKGSLP